AAIRLHRNHAEDRRQAVDVEMTEPADDGSAPGRRTRDGRTGDEGRVGDPPGAERDRCGRADPDRRRRDVTAERHGASDLVRALGALHVRAAAGRGQARGERDGHDPAARGEDMPSPRSAEHGPDPTGSGWRRPPGRGRRMAPNGRNVSGMAENATAMTSTLAHRVRHVRWSLELPRRREQWVAIVAVLVLGTVAAHSIPGAGKHVPKPLMVVLVLAGASILLSIAN